MKLTHPETYPPLIIFLDINMPVIDGFGFLEAFRGLRKKFDLRSWVVMMFTSSSRPSEIKKAMSYDFVGDYLTKGNFNIEDLTDKIKNLAEKLQ